MELARASKTEKHQEGRLCGLPLRMISGFELDGQQALLKKERRAKNSLLELDTVWHYHPTDKSTLHVNVGQSTINGWADLDDEDRKEPKPETNPHNKSVSQTVQLKERSVTETSSLVSNLKQELSRLESPERRKKQLLPGSHLFNIQVMSELNRKRKHSMKVAEIIRCRENRFMATSHFKKMDIPDGRPFTNAENRLNQNKTILKKLGEAIPDSRITSQSPYRVTATNPFLEPQFYNQNELKRFLKQSNPQSKLLKTSKDFNLSKLDQARVSKNSFYHERRKDRLTLKNLLDL